MLEPRYQELLIPIGGVLFVGAGVPPLLMSLQDASLGLGTSLASLHSREKSDAETQFVLW